MKKKNIDKIFLSNCLLAFYRDVASAGYFEREDKISIKDFRIFINEWINEYIELEEEE